MINLEQKLPARRRLLQGQLFKSNSFHPFCTKIDKQSYIIPIPKSLTLLRHINSIIRHNSKIECINEVNRKLQTFYHDLSRRTFICFTLWIQITAHLSNYDMFYFISALPILLIYSLILHHVWIESGKHFISYNIKITTHYNVCPIITFQIT